jgi:hypothetical protein
MADILPFNYIDFYLLRLDTLDQNTVEERDNVLEFVGGRL